MSRLDDFFRIGRRDSVMGSQVTDVIAPWLSASTRRRNARPKAPSIGSPSPKSHGVCRRSSLATRSILT
jgi:hypothetical protein